MVKCQIIRSIPKIQQIDKIVLELTPGEATALKVLIGRVCSKSWGIYTGQVYKALPSLNTDDSQVKIMFNDSGAIEFTNVNVLDMERMKYC